MCSMYVWYACVCMCMHIHVYVYMCVCGVCACVVCVHVCVCAYVCVCVHVLCVCMCVCVCVCVCVMYVLKYVILGVGMCVGRHILMDLNITLCIAACTDVRRKGGMWRVGGGEGGEMQPRDSPHLTDAHLRTSGGLG